MKKIRLKDVRKGDFFYLRDNDKNPGWTAPIWVRGEYCRDIKRYECYKYDDVNHFNSFKGEKMVFVEV